MYSKPILEKIKLEFESAANEEHSSAMAAYMRNKFEFYGIKSPERKAMTKNILKTYALEDPDLMASFTDFCWNQPQREWQYFGMELLYRWKKHWNKDFHLIIHKILVNKSWWDTVDFIAARIFGLWVEKYPKEAAPIVVKWNESDNFWLVRTTILHQLFYKDKTDEKLLFGLLSPHLESDEFFIQKAIGWSLRQYSKTNEPAVNQFVRRNKLKPVSLREALKYLKS